jgi:hypothetical protein
MELMRHRRIDLTRLITPAFALNRILDAYH